jgi:hypothetical protein
LIIDLQQRYHFPLLSRDLDSPWEAQW